jgi:hypothetical protein
MARPVVRRAAVLFVLVVLLAAPWSAAEPREGRRGESPQLWVQLWDGLISIWGDIGCVIDPSGRCGDKVDIGCVADPNGRCRDNGAPSNVDIGCGIDPHGGCTDSPPLSNADIGCVIDPNGRCGS